jgi:elongation factor G
MGEKIREAGIPADMMDKALEKRYLLLDKASMYSDDLMEAYLDDKVTDDLIYHAVRNGTLALEMTPVFMGSAFKNKGVQPLLDAIVRFQPAPSDVVSTALDLDRDEEPARLVPDPKKPLVLIAFKLDDTRFGQLTYVWIYQGRLKKGDEIKNTRTGKFVRVGRLIRMHADETQEIDAAEPGDIVALFGIDCASGDTFTSGQVNYSLTAMFVPNPVISLSLKTDDNKSAKNMAKALNRFCKENPTFQTYVDSETGETIIRGMGELHLDVYLERMHREYKISLETGAAQMAYRESLSRPASFNYTHKKQTGGAGQYGRVAGTIEPLREEDFDFVDDIKGGVIPSEYIPACRKVSGGT